MIAQARGGNPYAQQAQAQDYPQQAYGQGQQGGDYTNGNPYAQQAYGQQQGYAAGGVGGAGGDVLGGGDFWSELSGTNSLLGQLQEQIQAVRTAHQQSLVCSSLVSPAVDGLRGTCSVCWGLRSERDGMAGR